MLSTRSPSSVTRILRPSRAHQVRIGFNQIVHRSYVNIPPPYPEPIRPAVSYRYLPALTKISERTGTPIPSLVISFIILHELTAIIPVIFLFFLFQTLGTGAAVVEWYNTHLRKENHQTDVDKSGGRWKVGEMTDKWYSEACRKVEYVGKGYGILGYDKENEQREGSISTSPERVSAQVTNAIAAYIVVKVSTSTTTLFPS